MKPSTLELILATLITCVLTISGCAGPVPPGGLAATVPPYPLPSNVPTPTWTPSGPPTPPPGISPAPLPTLDPSRVTWVPTRTPVPGTATPTLTPIVIPTQPPWNVMTPSATWRTYTDPTFSFSFDYPSNWYLDAPTGPRSPGLPEGTNLQIRNFDLGMRKGVIPPDVLGVEIALLPELAQYGTLENWIVQRGQSNPDATYSPLQEITVNGIRAFRWTVTQPAVPTNQTSIAVILGKGKWIYRIGAYPATSTQIGVFERVVSSFRVP